MPGKVPLQHPSRGARCALALMDPAAPAAASTGAAMSHCLKGVLNKGGGSQLPPDPATSARLLSPLHMTRSSGMQAHGRYARFLESLPIMSPTLAAPPASRVQPGYALHLTKYCQRPDPAGLPLWPHAPWHTAFSALPCLACSCAFLGTLCHPGQGVVCLRMLPPCCSARSSRLDSRSTCLPYGAACSLAHLVCHRHWDAWTCCITSSQPTSCQSAPRL